MNINETNKFIADYLENDKTNSGLMLSGQWGIGKSFYINNFLIPYIEKNTKYKCVTVSAYGSSNISELANQIYQTNTSKTLAKTIECIQKTLKSESGSLKAAIGFQMFDLSAVDSDFNVANRYLDLSDRFLILEDVERSSIDVLQIFGYLNYLTEHSKAKVLLVANEKAFSNLNRKKYIDDKEKVIRDTIEFFPDISKTIYSILSEYKGTLLNQLFVEEDDKKLTSEISNILSENGEKSDYSGINFRSLIYGIQKTVDMFNGANFKIKPLFLKEVLLGNIAFCLKLKSNPSLKWKSEDDSRVLGSQAHPLLSVSYNFIVYQNRKFDDLEKAQKSFFSRLELLKSNSELKMVLDVIYNYLTETELKLGQAISSLLQMIKSKKVWLSEYPKIGNYLISIKFSVGFEQEIKDCLDEMINTYEANDDDDTMFLSSGGIELIGDKANEEFENFKSKLLESKQTYREIVNFDYTKDNLDKFIDAILKNKDKYITSRGFASYINNERLVDLLKTLSAKEISLIRQAFLGVYYFSNIKDFFANDLNSLKDLHSKLCDLKNYNKFDKIQKLQIDFFAKRINTLVKTISS